MRSLQGLARDHAEAGRLGIEIDELRERGRRRSCRAAISSLAAQPLAPSRSPGLQCSRTAQVPPRRRGSPSSAAASPAYLRAHPPGRGTRLRRLRGLLAARRKDALRLEEFGTGFWANGQQAELCGELIDSGHKTILRLAQRFGLDTVDLLGAQPNGTEDTYFVLGAPYPKSQADIDFQPVHNTLQGQVQAAGYPTTYASSTAAGRSLDSMTLYDWIERYVPGGHGSPFGAVLDNAYNEEYGADTTGQSALNLVYLLGFKAKPGNFSIYGASDERYRIVGGNSKLPLAIAAALPSIHPGYQMTSIKRTGTGRLPCRSIRGGPSTTVTADHAISA